MIGLGSKPAETFGERRFEHDESEEADLQLDTDLYYGPYGIAMDCLWVNKIQWSADVLN